MSSLKISLDLSKVVVVDRFRNRATIQILGKSRCFDWPVEPKISGQAWLNLSDWVSKTIQNMLGERKFSHICICKTNGLRGQKLEDAWLEVAAGILMSTLDDGHVLRDSQGRASVERPIQVK